AVDDAAAPRCPSQGLAAGLLRADLGRRDPGVHGGGHRHYADGDSDTEADMGPDIAQLHGILLSRACWPRLRICREQARYQRPTCRPERAESPAGMRRLAAGRVTLTRTQHVSCSGRTTMTRRFRRLTRRYGSIAFVVAVLRNYREGRRRG